MSNYKICQLMVHTVNHSPEEMILNQEIFYDTKIGDVLQLSDPSGSPPLVLRVKTIPTSTGRMEISILKALAEAANLKPFTKILVQEVEEDNVIVDFVELAFKNKYLQRGNMLNFRQSLLGRSIHFGQNVIVDSMSAQIQDIRNLNTHIFSGIITKSTKFVFRSRSARIIWLVQISVEMWEYDQNGNLYFEKFLLEFVSPLLDLWKSLGASHMLSVIFFARTFYLETIDSLHHPEVFAQKSFHKVNDIGLDYQDFYKVVLENIAEINKEEHIQQLRKQFWEFPKELGWTLPVPKGSKFHESHSAGHSTGHSACTHGYTHGCTNGCHSNNNTNNSTTTTNDEAMNLDDLDSRPIQERLSGLPTIKERRTTQKRIKNDKKIYSVPSDAVHGNFLPAINTSLNILDKHYMDRDLQRTGNSIVMISAGSGIFKVRAGLAQITKQRMLDNGIGLDFISLSSPSVHSLPIVHNCNTRSCLILLYGNTMILTALENFIRSEGVKDFYEVPHWMRVSFVDCKVGDGSKMTNSRSESEQSVAWAKQFHMQPQCNLLTSIIVNATDQNQLIEGYCASLPTVLKSILLGTYSHISSHSVKDTKEDTPGSKNSSKQSSPVMKNRKRPSIFDRTQTNLPVSTSAAAFKNDSYNTVDLGKEKYSGMKNNSNERDTAPTESNESSGIQKSNAVLESTVKEAQDVIQPELQQPELVSPSAKIADLGEVNATLDKEIEPMSTEDRNFIETKTLSHNTVSEEELSPLRPETDRDRVVAALNEIISKIEDEFAEGVINKASLSRQRASTSKDGKSDFYEDDSLEMSADSGSVKANVKYLSELFLKEGDLNSNESIHKDLLSPTITSTGITPANSDVSTWSLSRPQSLKDTRNSSFADALTNAKNVASDSPLEATQNSEPDQNVVDDETANSVPPPLVVTSSPVNNSSGDQMKLDFSEDYYQIALAPNSTNSNNTMETIRVESPMGGISPLTVFSENFSSVDIPTWGSTHLPIVSTKLNKTNSKIFEGPISESLNRRLERLPTIKFEQSESQAGSYTSSYGSEERDRKSWNEKNDNPIDLPVAASAGGSHPYGVSPSTSRLSPSYITPSRKSRSDSYSREDIGNQGKDQIIKLDNNTLEKKKALQMISSIDFRIDRDKALEVMATYDRMVFKKKVYHIDTSEDKAELSNDIKSNYVSESTSKEESSSEEKKTPAESSTIKNNATSETKKFSPTNYDNTNSSGNISLQTMNTVSAEAKSPKPLTLATTVDATRFPEKVEDSKLDVKSGTRPEVNNPKPETREKSKMRMTSRNFAGRGNFVPQRKMILPIGARAPPGENAKAQWMYYRGRIVPVPNKSAGGEQAAPFASTGLPAGQILADKKNNVSEEQKTKRLDQINYYINKNQINPFRYEEGENYIKTVTHNRKRWSHVFPQGEAEKLDDFRLNWKSLAQPAILPLFTDYLPDVIELQRDYDVVNDYNVILDPGEKSFAKFEELVSELVNQRLIQEFQLIINVNKEAYQSYSRSKEVTLTTTKKVPQNYLLRPDEDKKKEIINHFYILTMGHRIQCFDYTVDKKPQVRVTQYRSKNAVNDDESSFTYHYEIWVPQIQEFQTMTQTFYQFPNPEYKWSKTDNILCGAVPYDGVDDGTKVKRHRYCVIPDKMDTIEDVNNYYTKLNQLIEFLNKYCDETIIVEKDTTLLPKSADIHHLNDNRSDMTLTATVTEGDSKAVTKTNTNPMNDKNNDMINTEGKGMESKGTGITSPRNTSERSSENTSVPTDRGDYNNSAATIANLYHNSSKAYSFARLFLPSPSKVVLSKPPINPTVSGPVSNSSNTGSVDTDEVLTGRKTHWIYLKYDNTAYTYRSFHLEIHWIVCDSWVVDDFISTLFRRCARIGIRIAQTPEFFCSANLNMHPLRVQPHIEVPYIDVPYSFPSPIRLIERLYFCRSNDWIFDSEQATDWKARGLLVPSYLDRDRDFLDNTSNADDDSLITSIPVTGSRVGNGYSPQMKAVNDKFNASVTSAVRRAPSLSSLSKSLQRFVFKQDDDSEVKGSGQLGNFSSSPSGTKKLPSNHSDRQYLYCNALAAVRVAAQGFVWLHHATAKVSDLNTSREEKKTLALAKLQELQNVSHAIVACYDVIIWLVEKAMSHDKNRIKSSDSLAMDEGLRDDTVPLRRTPSAMSQDSDSGFDYQNNDSIDRPFSDSPGLLLRSRSQSQDGKPEEKEVVEAPSEIKDAEENVGIAARAIRDNTTNSSSPSHGPRSLL